MSYLRSLLVTTPLILLATIMMGTLSMIASLFDGSGNSQHRLACIWGKMLLAASFIRVRVDGLEKLDPRGTYVFVSNHQSLMDIPAILAKLPHQFRFFAKLALYSIPFLGTHLKRAGHLPVDRSNVRASLKSMTAGAQIVAQRGISVLLFPEGGRAPEGLREFKEGSAYIAIKAGVPAVPIAIVGLRELLPMGSIHVRSGRVALRIGDPISTKDLKVSDRELLTKQLYDEIGGLIAGKAN